MVKSLFIGNYKFKTDRICVICLWNSNYETIKMQDILNVYRFALLYSINC